MNSLPLASVKDPSMKVWDHSFSPSLPCFYFQTSCPQFFPYAILHALLKGVIFLVKKVHYTNFLLRGPSNFTPHSKKSCRKASSLKGGCFLQLDEHVLLDYVQGKKGIPGY
jgi:hypothetical protein